MCVVGVPSFGVCLEITEEVVTVGCSVVDNTIIDITDSFITLNYYFTSHSSQVYLKNSINVSDYY